MGTMYMEILSKSFRKTEPKQGKSCETADKIINQNKNPRDFLGGFLLSVNLVWLERVSRFGRLFLYGGSTPRYVVVNTIGFQRNLSLRQ